MLYYFLIMIMTCYVNAFEVKINKPSCSSCKWNIPDKRGVNDYSLCKMFKPLKYDCQCKGGIMYEFAEHCRNNENMCGQNAFLFEPYNDIQIQEETLEEEDIDTTISDLLDEYDDINNRCCGEVNETDELDDIERDLMNIINRLKNYHDKF